MSEVNVEVFQKCYKGDLQGVLQMLLNKEATVDSTDPIQNSSLLQWAASGGQLKVMENLIKLKASINHQNNVGNTPLHSCCKNAHEDCAKLLLKKGADATLLNKDGKSAVDLLKHALEKKKQKERLKKAGSVATSTPPTPSTSTPCPAPVPSAKSEPSITEAPKAKGLVRCDSTELKGSLKIRIEYFDVKSRITKSKTFFYRPELTLGDVLYDMGQKLEIPEEDLDEFGLFMLPLEGEMHNGVWLKMDRTLVSYGLAKYSGSLLFKWRHRPVWVSICKGGNKAVLYDDSEPVSTLFSLALENFALNEFLFAGNTLVDMASTVFIDPQQSLRDQGFGGDLSVTICTAAKVDRTRFKIKAYTADDGVDYVFAVQTPSIEGILQQRKKHRSRIKSFKKRFWLLRKDRLSVFQNEKMTELSLAISVRTLIEARPLRSDISTVPQKMIPAAFEVLTPTDSFILVAEDRRAMFAWVDELETARKIYADNPSFWARRKEHAVESHEKEEEPAATVGPTAGAERGIPLEEEEEDENVRSDLSLTTTVVVPTEQELEEEMEEVRTVLQQELASAMRTVTLDAKIEVEQDNAENYSALVQLQARMLEAYISTEPDLLDDPYIAGLLPLHLFSEKFARACACGVFLCCFINALFPNTIDPRVIHMHNTLSLSQRKDNVSLALSAAFTVGVDNIASVKPEDLIVGSVKTQSYTRLLMWKLLEVSLHDQITTIIIESPQLVKELTMDDENPDDLVNRPPLEIVDRWLKHTLVDTDSFVASPVSVASVGEHILDSHGLLYWELMLCIDREIATLADHPLSERVPMAAAKIGCRELFIPEVFDVDFLILHQLLLTELFITSLLLSASKMDSSDVQVNVLSPTKKVVKKLPSIPLAAIPSEDELPPAIEGPCEPRPLQLNFRSHVGAGSVVKSPLLMELELKRKRWDSQKNKVNLDAARGREIRAFKIFLISLGVETPIRNLPTDLRTGVIFLQAFDKVKPGCVDWRKVSIKSPISPFKQVENCNQALSVAASLGLKTVGIGGPDLHEGNITLQLGLCWQILRYHVLNSMKGLKINGKKARLTETDVVAWANQTVTDARKKNTIRNLEDKSISSGLFLIDLLYAVEPQAVNYDNVTPGRSREERELNAKYALSVAWRLGVLHYLVWEDIVEVKSKMILTFLCAVAKVSSWSD
eukprot:GCRY01005149.1.p1 GENE.GCRY01005149.1~~GCRY01005149.1.p1  ORF type:complete len:1176 (-),score=354.20 GCRY01005149.1:462-3989(-)